MQKKKEMEVQGSSWSARERMVIARMENYLNKEDCLKLEIEEVNLRFLLMNASRRGSRIFEIFSTEEKSEHLVASKVRCDERQRRVAHAQEERSQRSVQDENDKRATFAGPRHVKGSCKHNTSNDPFSAVQNVCTK